MKLPFFVVLVALCLVRQAHAQEELDFIGRSTKCRVLDVSPDGKWLLSWDGVTENSPSTNPGDRLVWNLATKTSRYISTWPGLNSGIYDCPCGWTPDNRIWQMTTHSQPLGEGNAPFIALFFLQKPDGSAKVAFSDPHERVWFDDQSFYDDITDFHFSPDGAQLVCLTESYFRVFNARSGKMTFRRRLTSDERQTAFLSPNRTRIITQAGIEYDEQQHVQNAGRWALREARSGRVIRRLHPVSGAQLKGFAGDDAFVYQQATSIVKAQLSDGKVLFTTPNPLNPPGQKAQLVTRDPLTLQTRVWRAPQQMDWRTLKLAPNTKTMFGLVSDFIYRFPAKEVKPEMRRF